MATENEKPLEAEVKRLLDLTPDQLDEEMVKAVESNPELAAEVFPVKNR
jgi:hypothetical protein